MKSDLRPGGAPGDAERKLLASLRERLASAEPGYRLALADLQALDPFGDEAFAALAQRFGAIQQADGAWRLERQPRWLPDWVAAEHEPQCFDLFETAFGYRIDPRLWRWKYRDAPRPGMGAWRDGQLLAFYGAMPRQVLFRGEPASTVQIGDVMVHPAERGVMTRSGPFQIAASTFIDRSVGYGRPHLFGFGFPTDKALQVARKLGLYEQVDRMTELTWPTAGGWTDSSRLLRCRPIGPGDEAALDGLWAAMARDFPDSIIGVRDAAYVHARYAAHPTVRYECLLVRRLFGGAPQGLVVLRHLEDARNMELMDVVGPRRSFPALVAAARGWARRRGASSVRAWVTASHAGALTVGGATATPLDLLVPANVWSRGPSAEDLRDRWWLTAGDTDFR